jgi:hypothetical protein
MRLGRTLMGLKAILENNYDIKEVQFRCDLEYGVKKGIPGFSFIIKSPDQIQIVEQTILEIQKEVMKDYTPKEVVGYLLQSNLWSDNRREFHLIVKQGDKEHRVKVLDDLAEKLVQHLQQRPLGKGVYIIN